jgi:hypothetical protein
MKKLIFILAAGILALACSIPFAGAGSCNQQRSQTRQANLSSAAVRVVAPRTSVTVAPQRLSQSVVTPTTLALGGS